MANIVTGYRNELHVSSDDVRAFNQGVVGAGHIVLKTGEQFSAEKINNNSVSISDGDLLNQGTHIRINTGDVETLVFNSGLPNVKRNDLIVMRYEKDGASLIESASLAVIQGTSGATATDPDIISGNILAGELIDDFPLYRVKFEGIEIVAIEPLFVAIDPMTVAIENVKNSLNMSAIPSALGNTVGGAISRINTDLSELFRIVQATKYVTGTGGNAIEANLTFEAPIGYTPIFVVPADTQVWSWAWSRCTLTNDTTVKAIISTPAEKTSFGTIRANVICVKDIS